MKEENDFRVRPGRIRAREPSLYRPFVARAVEAAERAGGGGRFSGSGLGRGGIGRGRSASLNAHRSVMGRSRGAVVKARVVRQGSGRTPLSVHLNYLKRDGVSREGAPGMMFDAEGEKADERAFGERCADDRHHFRFIVSPDDATELSDLKAYTRDLMAQAEHDLGTSLDWVAVDHWNTGHPHIHVLVRGRTDQGEDLVISRDYISSGLRHRAGHLVTLELGPRSDLEIRRILEAEIGVERWTRLDRAIARDADRGVVDLRPPVLSRPDAIEAAKVGRMNKLTDLGLAEPLGPAQWRLRSDAEQALRQLGQRNDIIARLHRALGAEHGSGDYVLDSGALKRPVLGRLAARGLDDELKGTAFVVIDGVDGRAHHVRLPSLDAAGDSALGSVVEARWTEPASGRRSVLVIAVRSDLDLDAQVKARGATWLDRQLVAREPAALAERGFGTAVSEALGRRLEHLAGEGFASRDADRLRLAPDLLGRLRRRELETEAGKIARETGLTARPVQEGEYVTGVVRRRLTLASGRFAMIDDGLGFSLVPWKPELERQLGRHISGVALPGGGVDWDLGRGRGLGLG